MVLDQVLLSAPLFILVYIGYGVMKLARWPKSMSEALSRFVFTLALPAMLFHLMSDFSKLPPVDTRLLIAFFGACLLVFLCGRLLSWKLFKLDGSAQSVFAMGGIFSNNVMLGIPLTKTLLGEQALPAAALIVVFNALILWVMVTVSVEWARHSQLTVQSFKRIVIDVLKNPIVAAILLGSLWGLTGLKVPGLIDATLVMVATAAAPMALLALGMGLAEYGMGGNWRIPAVIVLLKLLLHPLLAWALCRLLQLSPLETQAVVLMSGISVGANVYMMARQFGTMEGPVAASLVASTALAAVTTPLAMALIKTG